MPPVRGGPLVSEEREIAGRLEDIEVASEDEG